MEFAAFSEGLGEKIEVVQLKKEIFYPKASNVISIAKRNKSFVVANSIPLKYF